MKRRNFLKCAGLSLFGTGLGKPLIKVAKAKSVQIEEDNLTLDHWWPFEYRLTDEPCTRYEHTVDIPRKRGPLIFKRGVATLVGQLKRDVFLQQCDILRGVLKHREVVPSQDRLVRHRRMWAQEGFCTLQLLSVAWGITWGTTDILIDKEAAKAVKPITTVDHDIIEFTGMTAMNGRPIHFIPNLYTITSREIIGLNLDEYQFITNVNRNEQLTMTLNKNKLSGSIATVSYLKRKNKNEENNIQYLNTIPIGNANIC